MNKKTFLEHFLGEDVNVLSNIYEKINLSDRSGIVTFSNEFLPELLCREIVKIAESMGVAAEYFGGFDNCDRAMLSFNNFYKTPYPMELIKIKFSVKFQSVTHRDILGVLMSLGIKREKLGDLIIEESYGLVVVHEDIKDYIISNLVKIKNSSCDIETLSLEECKNFEKKFQEKIEVVSSLRFDSIVSSICNKSRNYAVNLINSGSCKINYLDIRDKSKEVKINDVITVRGYGKFKLDEVISSTRSGRIKVKIKKYV